MKVARLDTFGVAIPFRFAFDHRLAERTVSESLVVRLEDESGRAGFGECAPRGYVTGETVATARDRVTDVLFPRVAGRPFSA